MAQRAQPLKMGLHKITGLEDGTDANDAVNKSQLDAAVAAVDLTAYAPLANPTFTGDPKAPTPSTSDNDTSIATTAFVKAQAYAPLASPALSGTPTAPTASANNNSTQIATTAYVDAAKLWTRSFSTADQSFSSGNTGTTLTNLTSLSFSIAANANYAFKATLFIEAGTTGGIKVGISNPSSPSAFTAAGYAAGNSSASNVIAANAISGGTTIFSNAGAGWALAVIQIYGRIYNGSNAGTVNFQGAQNTSNATNTTFQKGSFIEYSLIS